MRIAVIGSGIAGLSAAYQLAKSKQDVCLFEANDYFGGHTHTVDVDVDGHRFGVDTGFLVFNHHTYPNLVRLFQDLQIDTVNTDMSFSVSMPGPDGKALEWSGTSLDTVFAQRSNLLRPGFWRMLRDILRFNKQTTDLAKSQNLEDWQMPLGQFLDRFNYSHEFRQWYLLPMAACIWSCPTETMMAFPVASFATFCHNHGLLQITDRPQWRTVRGGARQYVEKILQAIPQTCLNTPVRAVRIGAGGLPEVQTDAGSEVFDQVVFACHSDQTLRLLEGATTEESAILSAVRYQPNVAVLHTDASVLPARQKAWSAWNYQSEGGAEPRVCVNYLLNQLQPLPCSTPVIVTLNPVSEIAKDKIIASYDYAHPVFDQAAVAAQQQLNRIQGQRRLWFAGAWTGYGFHEDGLKSGLKVAQGILQQMLAEQSWADAA